MSHQKNKPTKRSVSLFLNGIEDKQKHEDSWTLYRLFEEVTNESGKIWGTSIIGFGTYHYKYKTGREGDWFLAGFAPRKTAFSLYLMCDLNSPKLNFEGLGKYRLGKGCLYVKRLTKIIPLYQLILSILKI